MQRSAIFIVLLLLAISTQATVINVPGDQPTIQATISNYVTGKRQPEDLTAWLALAKALNCSLEDLTGIPLSKAGEKLATDQHQPSEEALDMAKRIASLPKDSLEYELIMKIFSKSKEKQDEETNNSN